MLLKYRTSKTLVDTFHFWNDDALANHQLLKMKNLSTNLRDWSMRHRL